MFALFCTGQVVPHQFSCRARRDAQVSGKGRERCHQGCVSSLVQCTQVSFTEHPTAGKSKEAIAIYTAVP